MSRFCSVFFLSAFISSCGIEMSNDFTTTYSDPPLFNSVESDLSSIANDESLSPLYLDLESDQALLIVKEIAAKRWFVSATEENRVLAVATTRIFRFKDDVVVEVRPEERGSSVHMRSRSRVGKWDMGANSSRIKKFMSDLDSAVRKKSDNVRGSLPKLDS